MEKYWCLVWDDKLGVWLWRKWTLHDISNMRGLGYKIKMVKPQDKGQLTLHLEV